MDINVNEVIECGDKLYYDINPTSQMDVPSFFYESLEPKWMAWSQSGSDLSFYEYCKSELDEKSKSD